MKTTTRKLTFKKASLISAIIAGTPFLVLLVLRLLKSFIENLGFADDIIPLGYSLLAWMISCIVFSMGIIRDGEHFPSIPKWVRCVLQIWTFLFVVNFLFFLLMVFAFSAKASGEFTDYTDAIAMYDISGGILWLFRFAGEVLCFHYMIWFLYLYKRPSANTDVSRNSPWMKCVARVTIAGVIGTTILAVSVAVYGYGIMYTKQPLSDEIQDASLIMYLSYIIIASLPLSLCLFLLPIINRRANKQLAATQPSEIGDTISDGNTEQIGDAQPTIEK